LPPSASGYSGRFGWLGKTEGSAGFFDLGGNRTWMKGVRIADAGDVDVSLDAERTREAIRFAVSGLPAGFPWQLKISLDKRH